MPDIDERVRSIRHYYHVYGTWGEGELGFKFDLGNITLRERVTHDEMPDVIEIAGHEYILRKLKGE